MGKQDIIAVPKISQILGTASQVRALLNWYLFRLLLFFLL